MLQIEQSLLEEAHQGGTWKSELRANHTNGEHQQEFLVIFLIQSPSLQFQKLKQILCAFLTKHTLMCSPLQKKHMSTQKFGLWAKNLIAEA